jgi:uncharacterized iron-regulated membrane protein
VTWRVPPSAPFRCSTSLRALQWQGKVHFGVILGWSVLAAIVLWCVPIVQP